MGDKVKSLKNDCDLKRGEFFNKTIFLQRYLKNVEHFMFRLDRVIFVLPNRP